ncbi:MAG: hypothetical protein Q7T18_12355 [Sedimentisphaerales bacterium]|nr:hypothetical protein [Sedimentisphaerales bacterium]
MDFSTILAATANTAQNSQANAIDINLYWQQILTLHLRESLTLIAFGAVCIIYGWRIFTILVSICAGVIGMVLGMEVGKRVGSEVWGGVIGLIVLASAAVPLLKWAVSVLAAIAGGIITGGIWYACGLPQQYLWAGALVGAVAGGMISFIVFKISVMLFTSLAGTAMALTGVLALLNLYEPTSKGIQDIVLGHIWAVPAALIIPTIGFIVLQNKFVKGSSSWEV